MASIVIAGGTGLLGRALAAALRRDGHTVTVLTRQPTAPGEVRWSPDTPDAAWTALVDNAAAVVNLAGTSIASGRWTAARKRAIRESRLTATRALVQAMRDAGRPPALLLNASAVGYYGVRGDEPLVEQSPAGQDFLAEVCRAWEAAAHQASPAARVVLLRSGVVLARDGGALPQLARPFRFFAGGPAGSGEQYVSWIHLHDWIEMARWLLADTTVDGPVNATAPAPVTNAELASALGRALHRPARLRAPAFALRLLLGEMADALILGGQRVLPAAATGRGFTFRYPTIDLALGEVW